MLIVNSGPVMLIDLKEGEECNLINVLLSHSGEGDKK